jgi:dethiobiotin synthetase
VATPIVLVGTGTSVGKTYVAERILRAAAGARRRALGYKPLESGVSADSDSSDIARLTRASSFHVKPELASQTFAAAVSPHLAARWESRAVDLGVMRREIARASASAAEVLLVELPGGAFSPLADSVSCAQFARTVPGAQVLLVAPDRLGVLHDIAATTRACAAVGLPLFGLVLSAPQLPDPSTGHNSKEVSMVTSIRLLGSLPRAPAEQPVGPSDPVLGIMPAVYAASAPPAR